MDGVMLLEQAQAAGLVVAVAGDRLVIRGPRRAEPVAKMLLAQKPLVMAALAKPKLPMDVRPAEWRARHAEALAFWRAFYPADEAARIAWGELVNRRHRSYGLHIAAGICAGCGTPLGEGWRSRLATGRQCISLRLIAYYATASDVAVRRVPR